MLLLAFSAAALAAPAPPAPAGEEVGRALIARSAGYTPTCLAECSRKSNVALMSCIALGNPWVWWLPSNMALAAPLCAMESTSAMAECVTCPDVFCYVAPMIPNPLVAATCNPDLPQLPAGPARDTAASICDFCAEAIEKWHKEKFDGTDAFARPSPSPAPSSPSSAAAPSPTPVDPAPVAATPVAPAPTSHNGYTPTCTQQCRKQADLAVARCLVMGNPFVWFMPSNMALAAPMCALAAASSLAECVTCPNVFCYMAPMVPNPLVAVSCNSDLPQLPAGPARETANSICEFCAEAIAEWPLKRAAGEATGGASFVSEFVGTDDAAVLDGAPVLARMNRFLPYV